MSTHRFAESINTRKGQIWSIDYVIGMLLFLLAIIIGLKMFLNTYGNQEFEILQGNAERMSDLLMSEGYPNDWDNETLFQIGLTTGSNINITKLRYLYNMDPNRARSHLKTRNNYYLFFQSQGQGFLYFNGSCGYGDEGIIGEGGVQYYDIAYYFSNIGGDTYIRDYLGDNYNVDYYFRDGSEGMVVDAYTINGSLYNLTNKLDYYETIILEDPGFDLFSGDRPLTEISYLLEEWLSKGKLLIITGKVGLGLFALANFPVTEDGAGNITIQNEHVDIPFEEGDGLIFTDKYTITPQTEIEGYTMLGNYSNDQIGMATWNYGEGKIFYYGDSEADYGNGDYSNISEQINHTLSRVAVGYCKDLNIDDTEADNFVKIERYVVLNNKITKLGLFVWE
ncbi:MAG: hypothetical protein KKG59_04735 [Nanoarchaeota archaeon]|nr:hypothetical protein [Nanoarchaeota archaeon]